jgi:hypothetical protein
METAITLLAYGVFMFLLLHGGDAVKALGRRKCGGKDCPCRSDAD